MILVAKIQLNDSLQTKECYQEAQEDKFLAQLFSPADLNGHFRLLGHFNSKTLSVTILSNEKPQADVNELILSKGASYDPE